MVESLRSATMGSMQTCPTCDAPREGAPRYCPACGLDFWRAAAGESGTAPDSQPVAAPSSRTGFAPNFLAIGVIGVIVLGVAGVTSAVVLGALPFGGPGVGAAPTASPLSEEDRLVNRFFRQVRDPDAAFVVASDGEILTSGLPVDVPPITVAAKVSLRGDDWAGWLSIVEGDEAVVDADVMLVDGIGYVRLPDADWVSEEVPERYWSINAFARISTVTEVDYVDSEMVDGQRRHRLVVTKWLGGREFTDYLHRFARIDSRDSRMEIMVDDLGVPTVAELVMQVVATDDNDVTATFDLAATYRISAWDDVEPIEPPI